MIRTLIIISLFVVACGKTHVEQETLIIPTIEITSPPEIPDQSLKWSQLGETCHPPQYYNGAHNCLPGLFCKVKKTGYMNGVCISLK
jgi:hypothetical protein